MSWPRPVRIVGLGSPHGQDAAGWLVAEALEKQAMAAEIRRVAGPQDLLHGLDGAGTLVVIDAVQSGRPLGTLHRLVWPATLPEGVRPTSSHGMGLAETLRLAETLGMLPACVEIHGVEIDPGAPFAGNEEVEQACGELGRRLTELAAG